MKMMLGFLGESCERREGDKNEKAQHVVKLVIRKVEIE